MLASTESAVTAAHAGGNALARFAHRLRVAVRRKTCGPIGLEISAEKLHMVQFDATTPVPRIRAAISMPYAGGREALLKDDRQFRTLVSQALASRSFRGNKVVSCMAPADVRIMTLSYQRAAGEDDAVAIIREMRERLKAELDGLVVDFLAIRGDSSDSAERSSIVAAAPRQRVMAYLEALRRAGLDPVALDIGPAALARLVGTPRGGQHHANTLLINFGQAKSYMSVIWGRRLMLDRDFEFGEERLVARLSRTLELDASTVLEILHGQGLCATMDPESDAVAQTVREVLRPDFAALADEVNKTLIYTASRTRGQSVERIYLLGSVARYAGIAVLIQGLVSVPVAVFNPFEVYAARDEAAHLEELDPIAGVALATGLALRANDHG